MSTRDAALSRPLRPLPAYRGIVLNALSLTGTTAVTAAFGAAYWFLAARAFSPSTVGVASATVSAMTLLGTIALLGFNTVLLGELPSRREGRRKLVTATLMVVGGAGAALGYAFTFVADAVAPDVGRLLDEPVIVLAFTAGVALTAVSLIVDRVAVALFVGHLQLARNVVLSVTKLAGLGVVVLTGLLAGEGMAVLLTWVLGLLVSLGVLVPVFVRRGAAVRACRPDWAELRRLVPTALRHHVLNVAVQAPAMSLPIVATGVLGARNGGFFFAVWMIAELLFAGARSLSTAVHASAAASPSDLSSHFRFTLGLAGAVGVAGITAVGLGGGLILQLLGADYAAEATTALRLAVLGVLPMVVQDHYVTLHRLRGGTVRAARRVLVGGAIEVTAAVLGGVLGGLEGLVVGWLLGASIKAATMWGPVRTALRRPGAEGVAMPAGSGARTQERDGDALA